MLIWGLVAAKAKQGMSASQTEETVSIRAYLLKACTFCFLIIVASACSMY